MKETKYTPKRLLSLLLALIMLLGMVPDGDACRGYRGRACRDALRKNIRGFNLRIYVGRSGKTVLPLWGETCRCSLYDYEIE